MALNRKPVWLLLLERDHCNKAHGIFAISNDRERIKVRLISRDTALLFLTVRLDRLDAIETLPPSDTSVVGVVEHSCLFHLSNGSRQCVLGGASKISQQLEHISSWGRSKKSAKLHPPCDVQRIPHIGNSLRIADVPNAHGD